MLDFTLRVDDYTHLRMVCVCVCVTVESFMATGEFYDFSLETLIEIIYLYLGEDINIGNVI